MANRWQAISTRAGGRRLTPSHLASTYGLIVAWVAVIVVFSALRPSTFFTAVNFQTIFDSQAVLLILTLALIVPLMVGEFDLSVAGVLGISMIMTGYLNVIQGWPVGWAVLVAMLIGLAAGAVNAFFILVVGVESIVVTLGMGTLLTGLGFGISELAVGGISQNLVNISRDELFGIQLVFYYALALTVLVWYVFKYTPLGRYMYFVGAGRDVARLSGIRVDMIRAGSLIAASFISALAGVLLAGLLGSADPNASADYLLPAFAAAFLGATAITPGRFNAWGSFIAVYFLVTGITGLEIIGLSGWIEQVFYGAALILAVAFSRLAGRRRLAPRASAQTQDEPVAATEGTAPTA
jgi:ribose transport system permease protein